MLNLIGNYSHRFSNAKNVYCITNNNVMSIQQRTFYSVPYKPVEIDRTDPIIKNAIVAYIDRELCCKHIEILKTTLKEKKDKYKNCNMLDTLTDINLITDIQTGIIPFKLSMQELKQLSKFIGMPIAILINEQRRENNQAVYNVYIDFMRGGESDINY